MLHHEKKWVGENVDNPLKKIVSLENKHNKNFCCFGYDVLDKRESMTMILSCMF